MGNDKNKVHFNLQLPNGQRINVEEAVGRGKIVENFGIGSQQATRAGAKITDWELYQISQNPSWHSRITWYEGSKVVSTPNGIK